MTTQGINKLVQKPVRQGPSMSMVLIGVGLALVLFAYVAYLGPESRVYREFQETTCTIVDKRLIALQDRNGTVYRPEFHIRFQVAGQTYDVLTYNITGETTSGRAQKEEILSRYEVGRNYPCWYDPADPQQAVLVRGYSTFGLILAGLGVLVMLIGGVGMM